MHQLIQSFIVSSTIFLVDAYSKHKRSLFYYLTIFFLVAGMGFLFAEESVHATQQEHLVNPPNAKKHIRAIQANMQVCRKQAYTQKDKKYYQKMERYHDNEGHKCYENAKSRMWYLPNLTDREKARYCFTCAITTAMPGDPRAKIVGTIAQLIIQFGLDWIDEYNYVKNQLNWCAYHYEMSDFYYDVLRLHFN